MDKYKIKLNPRAFKDIDSILEYIALEKLSPENAQGQTNRIWKALKNLIYFLNRTRKEPREDMQEKDTVS